MTRQTELVRIMQARIDDRKLIEALQDTCRKQAEALRTIADSRWMMGKTDGFILWRELAHTARAALGE